MERDARFLYFALADRLPRDVINLIAALMLLMVDTSEDYDWILCTLVAIGRNKIRCDDEHLRFQGVLFRIERRVRRDPSDGCHYPCIGLIGAHKEARRSLLELSRKCPPRSSSPHLLSLKGGCSALWLRLPPPQWKTNKSLY